jgi:hypothetical protein
MFEIGAVEDASPLQNPYPLYSIKNIPNRSLMLGTATDRFVRRRDGSEFKKEAWSED